MPPGTDCAWPLPTMPRPATDMFKQDKRTGNCVDDGRCNSCSAEIYEHWPLYCTHEARADSCTRTISRNWAGEGHCLIRWTSRSRSNCNMAESDFASEPHRKRSRSNAVHVAPDRMISHRCAHASRALRQKGQISTTTEQMGFTLSWRVNSMQHFRPVPSIVKV